LQCSAQIYPLKDCEIQLEFEQVPDLSCSPYIKRAYSFHALNFNSTLGSEAENITCNYTKITGTKQNHDVANFDETLSAYDSLRIMNANGSSEVYIIWLKTQKTQFIQQWENRIGKADDTLDFRRILENFYTLEKEKISKETETFTLSDANPQKSLTFRNLVAFRKKSNLTGGDGAQMGNDVIVTHLVRAEQLVGYCSAFKLYFSVWRMEMATLLKDGKVGSILKLNLPHQSLNI